LPIPRLALRQEDAWSMQAHGAPLPERFTAAAARTPTLRVADLHLESRQHERDSGQLKARGFAERMDRLNLHKPGLKDYGRSRRTSWMDQAAGQRRLRAERRSLPSNSAAKVPSRTARLASRPANVCAQGTGGRAGHQFTMRRAIHGSGSSFLPVELIQRRNPLSEHGHLTGFHSRYTRHLRCKIV